MIRVVSRIAGIVAIAALLSACSSEKNGTESLPKVLSGTLSQALKARQTVEPELINLSAAEVAKINVPVLQINPEFWGELTSFSVPHRGVIRAGASLTCGNLLIMHKFFSEMVSL